MKFWKLAIFIEIQSIIFKCNFIKVLPSLCWTCRVWKPSIGRAMVKNVGKFSEMKYRNRYPFFLIKWAKHLPWNLRLLELQAINIDLIFLRNYCTRAIITRSWLLTIQLNKYETDRYVLQNFQCTTMLIYEFCKICDHEIVFKECKSKQKQF